MRKKNRMKGRKVRRSGQQQQVQEKTKAGDSGGSSVKTMSQKG